MVHKFPTLSYKICQTEASTHCKNDNMNDKFQITGVKAGLSYSNFQQ